MALALFILREALVQSFLLQGSGLRIEHFLVFLVHDLGYLIIIHLLRLLSSCLLLGLEGVGRGSLDLLISLRNELHH